MWSLTRKNLRIVTHSLNKANSIFVTRNVCVNAKLCNNSSTDKPLISQKDIEEFKTHYPMIIEEFLKDDKYIPKPEVQFHLTKFFNYILANGHHYRGLTTVTSYKILEQSEKLTPESVELANFMGWIIEINENYPVFIDDIIDNGKMRRGVPCWHVYANNGMACLNDGLFLRDATFAMLQKFFSKHPFYFAIVHLFLDVYITVTVGQAIEQTVNKNGRINWKDFNMNDYRLLCDMKTSNLCFILPISVAMYMANKSDPELLKEVKIISQKIGVFCQVQNDYDDLYNCIKLRGGLGKDIIHGKLTWFAVQALQKGTPAQREVMEQHYGKNDTIIRNLYEELDLKNDFVKYREENFDKICNEIKNLSDHACSEVMTKVADSVFNLNHN